LYKAIVLNECGKIEIIENSFELNFDPKLFEKKQESIQLSSKVHENETQSKKDQTINLENQEIMKAKELVFKKENVLIQLNKSNLNLSQNRFQKNYGILLLIIDKSNIPFKTNVSMHSKKKQRSRFDESPGAKHVDDVNFQRNQGTSLQKNLSKKNHKKRPNIKAMSYRETYKLEDSTINNLNPQKLKKKVPVIKIFNRNKTKVKCKAQRKKSTKTLSYLNILEQQSMQSNFSSR
jgi:hypothetical protein